MWTPTHVQVTVHRARNLKQKGKGETNDAYVTISLGKEKYQTSIKERSKDPEWHEECDLPIPEENGMITLKAFHRNLLGIDEFLGYTEIPLEEFKIYERPRSRWYALKNRPNSKKPEKYRGEIEVKVTFIVQSLSRSQLSLNKLDKVNRSSSIKSMVNQVGGKLNRLSGRGGIFRTGSKTDLVDKKSDNLVSTSQETTTGGRAKSCRVVEPDPADQLTRSMLDLPNSTSQELISGESGHENDKDDRSLDTSFPGAKIPEPLVEEEETIEDPVIIPEETTPKYDLHTDNQKLDDVTTSIVDPEEIVLTTTTGDEKEGMTPEIAEADTQHSAVMEEKTLPEQPDYEAPLLKKPPTKPKRNVLENNDREDEEGNGSNRHVLAMDPTNGVDSAHPLSSLPEESFFDDKCYTDSSSQPKNNGWERLEAQEDSLTSNRRDSNTSEGANKENDDFSDDKPAKKRDKGKKVKEVSRRHTLQSGLQPKAATTHELHEGISEYKSEQERRSSIRESSLPPDVVEQFKDSSRDDLIKIILEQRLQLKKRDSAVKDYENYIDDLLVRVMESTPKILQTAEEKRQASPMRSINNQAYIRTFSQNPAGPSVSVRMTNRDSPQVTVNVQKMNQNNSNSKNNKSPAKEKKPFSLFKKGR